MCVEFRKLNKVTEVDPEPMTMAEDLFLGHHIGGDVITPCSDNPEQVRETPCPITKKRVRSFLGLVGHYRDHSLRRDLSTTV